MAYNIYIVGLGGQGVLTVGELIAQAMEMKGESVNFFPTKGMSQRGGFVQVQIRLGEGAGPALAPKSADLIISLERSEALKAKKYANEHTDWLFFDDQWLTSEVTMGRAEYPARESILAELENCCGNFMSVDSSALLMPSGKVARSNIFIMGLLIANTKLGEIITKDDILALLKEKWPKVIDANTEFVTAGLNYKF